MPPNQLWILFQFLHQQGHHIRFLTTQLRQDALLLAIKLSFQGMTGGFAVLTGCINQLRPVRLGGSLGRV